MAADDPSARPALVGALGAAPAPPTSSLDRPGTRPGATTVSAWGVAVTVAVTPVAGSGAAVRIHATALSEWTGQSPPPAGGTTSAQYAAGGAEVEFTEVFAAVPSAPALACLSRLVAVRARLAALNARLQAERAARSPPPAAPPPCLPEP